MTGAGVYIIEALDVPGVFKIGVTTKIQDRLPALQSFSPSRLAVRAFYEGWTRKDEQGLHRLFHEQRLHGEWFRLTEEDLASINRNNLPRRNSMPLPKQLNQTLGRCIVCDRNVLAQHKYGERPLRKKKRGRYVIQYWHDKCGDPYGKKQSASGGSVGNSDGST